MQSLISNIWIMLIKYSSVPLCFSFFFSPLYLSYSLSHFLVHFTPPPHSFLSPFSHSFVSLTLLFLPTHSCFSLTLFSHSTLSPFSFPILSHFSRSHTHTHAHTLWPLSHPSRSPYSLIFSLAHSPNARSSFSFSIFSSFSHAIFSYHIFSAHSLTTLSNPSLSLSPHSHPPLSPHSRSTLSHPTLHPNFIILSHPML